MICRQICAWTLVVAATAASGCSETTAPRPFPTVLVTNATCEAGRCATLEVRAYIWKFLIPYPPFGEEVLGEVPPGRTCLTFPPSWRMTVVGPDNSGKLDTVTTTWTPDDTIPLYLIALDSAVFRTGFDSAQIDSLHQGLLPYFDSVGFGSVGSTPNFTPRDAHGWTVTFPSAPVFGANLAPGDACQR
jgi:hypothetical protein